MRRPNEEMPPMTDRRVELCLGHRRGPIRSLFFLESRSGRIIDEDHRQHHEAGLSAGKAILNLVSYGQTQGLLVDESQASRQLHRPRAGAPSGRGASCRENS